MSARLLQDFKFSTCGGKIYYQVSQPDDNGIMVNKDVDQCAKLPDRMNTDLAKQLQAGVNLEQVNCKLLNPVGTVVLSSLETKIEIKTETKTETKTDESKED